MDLPQIDVEELAAQLANGASVVDVREPDEWDTARLANTRLMPLATVPDHVGDFDPALTHYVMCAKGGRSAQAVEFLRSRGIDAINVAGGIGAWIEAGHPTESGD